MTALQGRRHKPLALAKRDVRKCVERHLGCTLGALDATRLRAIRRELAALRERYRGSQRGAWPYGKSDARLVAYALGYYPYHIELVAEALAAVPELCGRRGWDLRLPHATNARPAETRFALVGCGAAPELYGLLRYIAHDLWRSGTRQEVVPNLKITLHEPEHRSWKPIADAITKRLLERHTWIKTAMEANAIRVGWSQSRDRIPNLELRGRYDFVLIQLVLNELDADGWVPWLLRACQRLHPGGLVCVIDTDSGVHSKLSRLPGFRRSVELDLRWGQEARRLDDATSACLFPSSSRPIVSHKESHEREKLTMRATASFLARPRDYQGAKADRPFLEGHRTVDRSAYRSTRPCVQCGAPVPLESGRVYCERHIRLRP